VLKIILATALLLASTLAAASPDVFLIGKAKISIVIPDGYCDLDYSRPSDIRVLTTFDGQAKGKHRRLAFMVNCEQLHDWRNGDLLTFSDFGYILLPEESVDQESATALDVFLNGMVGEIGHNRKNIISHRGKGYLEAHIKESVKELETGGSVDLGLIHRDNIALYTASLNKITTEAAEQKLSGVVTAITQVNGKPLFFYWFRGLDNLNTIRGIESDLRQWLGSVHEVN
jgi:hypothetical protein